MTMRSTAHLLNSTSWPPIGDHENSPENDNGAGYQPTPSVEHVNETSAKKIGSAR